MNKSKTNIKTNAGHHEHHGGTTVTGTHSTGNKTSKSANKNHEHGKGHAEKAKRRTNTMKNATSAILIGLAILTTIATDWANFSGTEKTDTALTNTTTWVTPSETFETFGASITASNSWKASGTMTKTTGYTSEEVTSFTTSSTATKDDYTGMRAAIGTTKRTGVWTDEAWSSETWEGIM